MTGRIQLTEEVREVLTAAEITDMSVKLVGQLDRKLYLAVNKVLAAAGGKWNRAAGAHVFAKDPREVLGLAVTSGEITDQKKARAAFYTPPDLADEVVAAALFLDDAADPYGKTPLVLEPSIGGGALAEAVWRARPKAIIVGVEKDGDTVRELAKRSASGELRGELTICCADFLTWDPPAPFACDPDSAPDVVVMNPPFTRGQDACHVVRAYSFLAPGGTLVAIVGGGALGRVRGKDSARFNALFDNRGEVIRKVGAGAFKSEGTNVQTMIIRLTKSI